MRPDLFAGFSVDSFPQTSMAAFALTAAADRTDDPVVIEEVGMALRHAVFEEGIDIGAPDLVAPIAARFNLEPLDAESADAVVRADWDEGKRRGVVGSPHFFTGQADGWFCPGLDISRDSRGDFVIAWKKGTENFVGSVFS